MNEYSNMKSESQQEKRERLKAQSNKKKQDVKKVDKEKTNELRVWLEENNIVTGVNIDEDTKRYYPYGTLASNVIGFTGSDNQGLEGIESYYDKTLSGTQGKILKLVDATGTDMGIEGEDYIAAKNGDDLVLTIDMTIQAIAEKYLKQACIDNVCTDGGNVIILNPKSGDILAMATYPNYNLNTPFEPNSSLSSTWDSLSKTAQSEALQKMCGDSGGNCNGFSVSCSCNWY